MTTELSVDYVKFYLLVLQRLKARKLEKASNSLENFKHPQICCLHCLISYSFELSPTCTQKHIMSDAIAETSQRNQKVESIYTV